MRVRSGQAGSVPGIKPEFPRDVVGVGAAEGSLGSISARPVRVQPGHDKALTKLILKKAQADAWSPGTASLPAPHNSSQVARCAITHGEGDQEPTGHQDPFQPRTLQDEAGRSFVITEFSLDGWLTPFDPLLPQLSTRIITQPAQGCWELA